MAQPAYYDLKRPLDSQEQAILLNQQYQVQASHLHGRRKPRPLLRLLTALGVISIMAFISHKFIATSPHLLPSFVSSGSRFMDPTWPIPPDIHVDHCADWSDGDSSQNYSAIPTLSNLPFSVSSFFELPVTSNILFFIARGSQSAGNIRISSSDRTGDQVGVEVRTDYVDDVDLNHARVCLISRSGGENGVGIFTRRRHDRRRYNLLKHDVIVYLPKGSGNLPLHIDNLKTDLPLFSHKLDALADDVIFKKLSLLATNAAISVESVRADTANVDTTNGLIEGSFNTSTSLTLSTVNGAIKTIVGLWNEGDSEDATRLKISTTNGRVDADVNLATGKSSGGKYQVVASTTIGSLKLAFPEAPTGSSLFLDASTTLGSADVQLHETYEGAFSLETTLQRPSVQVDKTVKDPTGQGRERKVEVRRFRSRAEGSIIWGEDSDDSGDVRIATTLAAVTLKV